jgi:glycosyltransferase involved in cell wall biosynthesis
MPVFNEESHLLEVLASYKKQEVRPDALVIIDDNSTDQSFAIAQQFCDANVWAKVYKHKSKSKREPGSKVVAAFNFGYSQIQSEAYDLIGKFDADIVLPANYFSFLTAQFLKNPTLGLASGVLHVLGSNGWHYEAIAKKSKVRGPVKLYRTACLVQIEGLKPSIGWDTADVFLAQFYGWQTKTYPTLVAKHLRPTGQGYSAQDAKKQGETFYLLRYSMPIAVIAAFKLSIKKRSPLFAIKCLHSYCSNLFSKNPRLVTKEQGKFIVKKRWNQMFKKG